MVKLDTKDNNPILRMVYYTLVCINYIIMTFYVIPSNLVNFAKFVLVIVMLFSFMEHALLIKFIWKQNTRLQLIKTLVKGAFTK